MRADVRVRVAVAGAELRMLVLAAGTRRCIGVDIDSGAFVRADHPAAASPEVAPKFLDLVSAPIGEPIDPPDQARPEAVSLGATPRRIGQMGRRRAGRYLQALVHAPQPPLLGFAGVSTPYWTLTGDRPSLALVAPDRGPELRRTSEGDEPPAWECNFVWAGLSHSFPLRNSVLSHTLAGASRRRTGGRDLTRILGFAPERLLVVVARPVDGYCTKEVAALLPGSRG